MQIFSLFIFVFTIFTFILTSIAISTITPNQNITYGETITSDDESFKMGFFSPSNSSTNRYFGIWYNKISVMTIVWVANRETPVLDNSGVLLLNDKGTLVLVNRTNSIIWSSNSSITRGNDQVAQLLDTGNLVIRNTNDVDPENYLWQSFDYPGDTFLPSMKIGKDFVRGVDKYLTSWKSVDDPSTGEYTVRFDSNGYPQAFLRKGSEVKHRFGPWNGFRLSGSQNLKPNDIYTFGFEFNEKEFYYKYELLNKYVVSRMILSPAGLFQRFTWVDRTLEWVLYLTAQVDDCDRYKLCGPNGICNINDSPACGCWSGFEPGFPGEWGRADWSNGCVRKVELNCSGGDGFVKHSNVKLPDTQKAWFNMSTNLEECEKECLKNCNCTAYANMDVRTRTGCLIWSDDLFDIRILADGQDIYVRMTAAELLKLTISSS